MPGQRSYLAEQGLAKRIVLEHSHVIDLKLADHVREASDQVVLDHRVLELAAFRVVQVPLRAAVLQEL